MLATHLAPFPIHGSDNRDLGPITTMTSPTTTPPIDPVVGTATTTILVHAKPAPVAAVAVVAIATTTATKVGLTMPIFMIGKAIITAMTARLSPSTDLVTISVAVAMLPSTKIVVIRAFIPPMVKATNG